MVEKLLAVAPHETDLMLSALDGHLADTLDRVHARHLCDKLGEKVQLGSGSLEHFVAGEQELGEQEALCSKEEVQRIHVRLGDADGGVSRGLPGHLTRFGKSCHVTLLCSGGS